MTVTQDVEHIVRLVIERLRSDGATVTSGDQNSRQQRALSANRQLVLDERVVGLALLDGQLERVQTVVVPQRAVVTPSVHDELRRRQIRLQRQTHTGSKAGHDFAVWLATTLPQYDLEQLGRLLGGSGGSDLRFIETRDLETIIAQLARQAGDADQRAILVTDRPELAACLANRSRQLRAAVACDSHHATRACQTMNANILAIDPNEAGQQQLLEMMKLYLCSKSTSENFRRTRGL